MKIMKNYKLVGVILIMLFSSLTTNAQFITLVAITGDSTASVNDIKTYQVNAPGTTIYTGKWLISSGGIIQSKTPTSVTIQWTSNGLKTISYKGTSSIGKVNGSYNVTVGSGATVPNAPPSPEIILPQSCTSAVLQMTGAIPTGETWYWQGTNSNGTSTSPGLSAAMYDYTVTSTGTYYLRARNSAGVWSATSSSVSVTLGTTGGSTWYEDSDGDGLGDPNSILVHCSQPTGYVSNNNDACPGTHGGGSTNGCVGGAMNNENYIYTITPRKEVTDISQLTQNKDALKSITYFDGLGRPKQSIAIKQSPSEQDIITHIEYDEFGRQIKDYLPYAKTNQDGFFRQNALTETNIFYDTSDYENTQNPFSEKVIESSPLGRVFEQAAPGEDWKLANNHTIKFNYATNHATEVKYFRVGFINKDFLKPLLEKGSTLGGIDGYYPAFRLSKNIIKDENWKSSDGVNHTTEEFKDQQGRVVLKRTYNNSDPHDTYYVYDHFGNLTYVIPPLVDTDNLFDEVLTPIPYDTSIVSTYPANQFTFNGSGFGQATAKIILTGGTYEYEVDFNFTSLSPSIKGQLFRSGTIGVLPFPELLSNTTMFTAAGAFNFEISNGTLYINRDLNAIPIPITSLNETYTLALPSNMVSYVAKTDVLEKLCYQYIYDKKNRLVEKKIPGKGWESIIYNESNLPILTQDSNLKLQNKWLFTKYDALGRTAYTGIINNSSTRKSLQNTVDGISSQFVTKNTSPTTIAGTTIYYNNGAYPTSISEIYTINYYDNYTFDKGAGTSEVSYGITPIANAKGLSTGNKVRVLDSSPVKWITTVSYYDDKSREIYIYKNNPYLDTTDKVKSKFDFIGQEIEMTSQHTKGTTTIAIVDKFTYDHVGRKIKQTELIEGNEEVIVENVYDNLGKLKSKGVGGKISQNRLEIVDYKYNIRGWLKEINDPNSLGNNLFAFKINYNTVEGVMSSFTPNLYNGNISQTTWRTANDNIKKSYAYQYDALDRITVANMRKGDALDILDNTINYHLENVSYDKNGNITYLKRSGHTYINASGEITTYGTMDDLSYFYEGNQLKKVKDFGNNSYGFKDGVDVTEEYSYDPNGNMEIDANKGITSIQYNHLNLPVSIEVGGSTPGTIIYKYDASGVKLEKIIKNVPNTADIVTKYAGNFIYKNDVLVFFNQTEGYVQSNNAGGYNYVYQYKDHLENIRLSYSDIDNDGEIDLSSEIIEENNYYPFGLKHKGYNNAINGINHKYGFGGMEEQDELGLNWIDITARNYDPALGRWMNIDNLAENPRQINLSPYNYSWNNPIVYSDPDGDCPQCITGALVGILLELSFQVGTSMSNDGLTFRESLDVLEYDKVALEGLTGALSGLFDGGASKMARFLTKKRNRELLAQVLGLGIDSALNLLNSAARNYLDGEDLLTAEDVANALLQAGFGGLVEELFPNFSLTKYKKKVKEAKKAKKKSKGKKKKKKKKAKSKAQKAKDDLKKQKLKKMINERLKDIVKKKIPDPIPEPKPEDSGKKPGE